MICHPKNVIVAGTPGAWVQVLNRELSAGGYARVQQQVLASSVTHPTALKPFPGLVNFWHVLWPGQDIDIVNGRFYFEHNFQNVEVQNIHQAICDAANVSVLSSRLPEYYDLPYPGPQELVAKFDGRPVVLSAPTMAPFLQIWRSVATCVIDIQAPEVEDLQVLEQWTKQAYTTNYLQAIRAEYNRRYFRDLKLFPRVFTITNAEVKERRFGALVKFLTAD